MSPSQAKQLIKNLSEKINTYNQEYYQLGGSGINDNEYDIILEQLYELENKFPDLRLPDSPSQRVGGEPVETFTNVRHNHTMLSLSNQYSKEDLYGWINSVKSRLTKAEVSFVCELKNDGVAISLLYENGLFKQAITRGNGEVGDDVSGNVKTIRSLPLYINKPDLLELRGEIFFTHQRFDLLNRQKEKRGDILFKNPRNAAAGTLRTKDPKIVSQRGLDIYLYDLVEGQISNQHSENLDYMKNLGFPVNPYRTACHSAEEIMAFCQLWETKKKTLPFDIDGVVVKLENLSDRELVGVTAKSPRWATAWKFKAKRVKSRLISIEGSIGRTGVLTPVANLEPVELLGTEVKRATLHNYDQVARLGIHHHDVLFVEKGGEIIPKIVGVDYSQREESSSPVTCPANCPVCNFKLTRLESEVDLRCENTHCPAVVEGALEHFVSKKGMDIRTLGTSLIRQLIKEGLVFNLCDIFSLAEQKAKLISLEGMGEKSIDNLLRAIEKSKTNPLNQFIYALGIRHIGEKAAKSLAIKAGSVESFLELDKCDLNKLPDFGEIMVDSIFNWIQTEKNRTLVQKVRTWGVNPKPLAAEVNQPFTGQSVVITGTLSKPRQEWKRLLEKAGFQVSSALSKKTSYLLVGKQAGSKLKKASKLNTPMLTEEGMEKLLGE